MARIRTIKPEFFRHESLYEAERETGLPLRVAFAGLWTVADREGRFVWRPRALKLDVLPYDEVDFSRVLDALATRGFIVRYTSGTEVYGAIPSWRRHQVINNRESASEIPEPTEIQTPADACPTRAPRDTELHVHAQGEGEGEGKGREGKKETGPPAAPPDSKGRRLAGDWTLPDSWRDWALTNDPTWTAEHAERVAASFADYWRAKAGADGRKVDWQATWRNWCRREGPMRGAQARPANWREDPRFAGAI